MRSAISAAVLALSLVAAAGTAAARGCDDAASRTDARVAAETACDCATAASPAAYRRCVRTALHARVSGGLTPSGCAKDVRRCLGRSRCGRPAAVICRLPDERKPCEWRHDAPACAAAGGVATACTSCCDGCIDAPPCGQLAGGQCGGACATGGLCQAVSVQGFSDCLCVPEGESCHTTQSGSGSLCTYGACPDGWACASLLVPDGSGSFTCGCAPLGP